MSLNWSKGSSPLESIFGFVLISPMETVSNHQHVHLLLNNGLCVVSCVWCSEQSLVCSRQSPFPERWEEGNRLTEVSPGRCLVLRFFLSLHLLLATMRWAGSSTHSISHCVCPHHRPEPGLYPSMVQDWMLILWNQENIGISFLSAWPPQWELQLIDSVLLTNNWRDFEDLPTLLWNKKISAVQDPDGPIRCWVRSELR